MRAAATELLKDKGCHPGFPEFRLSFGAPVPGNWLRKRLFSLDIQLNLVPFEPCPFSFESFRNGIRKALRPLWHRSERLEAHALEDQNPRQTL